MICKIKAIVVGFEVLMALNTKMAVFWVAVLCSLVDVYLITQHYNLEDS